MISDLELAVDALHTTAICSSSKSDEYILHLDNYITTESEKSKADKLESILDTYKAMIDKFTPYEQTQLMTTDEEIESLTRIGHNIANCAVGGTFLALIGVMIKTSTSYHKIADLIFTVVAAASVYSVVATYTMKKMQRNLFNRSDEAVKILSQKSAEVAKIIDSRKMRIKEQINDYWKNYNSERTAERFTLL